MRDGVGWGAEQEKAVWHVKASVEAVLSIGHHGPVDLIILRVFTANTAVVWSLLQAPIGECQTSRLWG